MNRIGQLPIDLVFWLFDHKYERFYFEENLVVLNRKKIRLFRRHGIECRHCGTKALYFQVQHHSITDPAQGNVCHLGLYAPHPIKQHGLIELTHDHVIPLAIQRKFGYVRQFNSQVLCKWCNGKKGAWLEL